MSTAAVLFTLITVTYGGNVSHSEGYTSLRLCEEAKSVAVTGRTIEEQAAYREAVKTARQHREDAWRVTHPPRAPRNDWERRMVESGAATRWGGDWGNGHIEGGLIYDDPDEGGMRLGRPSGDSIKYAECVIEPSKP